MLAPEFWNCGTRSVLPRLLSPLSAVTARATARRVARPGWTAPVPVICVGNVSVGGAGKTIVALDIGRRLMERGARIAFLTRGYGGDTKRPRRVAAGDVAASVGDEPLLLAELAATYVSADRAASARMAVADGAELLVMDDGLQNPTLSKTASLLVIDGAAGFGNGRLLPAGPLRETVAAASSRVRAAVLIGPDENDASGQLPASLPVFAGALRSAAFDTSRPLAAFAGIGRPDKFFASLEAAGGRLALKRRFADHHRYSAEEIARFLEAADRIGALAVTTPKDAVRLPAALASRVVGVGVELIWRGPAGIEAFLDAVVAR